MTPSDETTTEIRRIRRMLKQMHRLAEHSSLTGALSGGATDAITQYNLILARLGELGVVSGTLFPPLPQDASFDRLGVVSRLLEGYLEEEASPSEAVGIGQQIHIGSIGGLDELKDLGRIVRENLPDFLRKRPTADSETSSEQHPETGKSDIQSADPQDPTPQRSQNESPIPMPDFSR